MENEIWKVIKTNPRYLVSSIGNVKNIKSNRLVKKWIRDGYYRVVLFNPKEEKRQEIKNVHRLVAENFIENKFNYPCVNHKDENKLNNTIDNLEWCSFRYNCTYNNVHKKRGDLIKGRHPWNYGKKTIIPEEVRKKISETMKKKYKNGELTFKGNQYIRIKSPFS